MLAKAKAMSLPDGLTEKIKFNVYTEQKQRSKPDINVLQFLDCRKGLCEKMYKYDLTLILYIKIYAIKSTSNNKAEKFNAIYC